jgi:hypothetical protein
VLLLAAIVGPPFGLLWMGWNVWVQEVPLSVAVPLGIIAGVLFGLGWGAWMARTYVDEKIVMNVATPRKFLDELPLVMADLNFQPGDSRDGLFEFRPGFRAGIFAGKVRVWLAGGKATFVGPAPYPRYAVELLDAEPEPHYSVN